MNDFLEYDPKKIEPRWYAYWIKKGFFKAMVNKRKKPFTIVIPPPNVTGVLHMGHGLNNTIQDILIRYKRMENFEANWIPGTDHAGIATQTVVEKELLSSSGKTREQIGRSAFIKKVWEWKEKNGQVIIQQLKKIGASCDWDRERFTMDEGLSNAVKEVFIRLFKKGLIYRGNYIVNWCPRCTTALADDEVEHREHQDKLYYLRYPLEGSKRYIIVATTRPETMLGDTAVAVHPQDKRYRDLVGEKIILPLVNRQIPVIADRIVDKEFGTGAVKVTPSHDPNDFDMGKRHHLEFINIMNEKGIMNKNVPEAYRGLSREKCREAVMRDLQKQDRVEKVEDYNHSVGHCYRCDDIIEPYQSTQWFVKMKPLARPAIQAVEKGQIKFYPKRWTKVYLNWMNNIRDWCISRQIWWGHRIPVWYCQDCHEVIVERQNPTSCPKCKSKKIVQEEDVLDTWFSSWLWPFSVLGWPKASDDLDFFYPTDVLVTDPGIIFFWVARMIMAGLEFMKTIPFHQVHIHGVILDDKGRKMSKSLGNGIDPLEVVEKYGADALRYSIVSITPSGQNLLLSMDKFSIGRYFANKIFNAGKYIFNNYRGERVSEITTCDMDMADKWIVSRLQKLVGQVADSLKKYRFQEASLALNQFLWHEFCDWYLEISKIGIYRSDQKIKEKTFSVLFYVLEKSMKLLHPIMPFITEHIYQKIPNKEKESVMISSWPKKDKSLVDERSEKGIILVQHVITSVRNLRALMGIKPENEVKVFISVKEKEKVDFLNKGQAYIKLLAKISGMTIGRGFSKPVKSAVNVTDNMEIFIPLEGLVDFEKQVQRLKKSRDEIKLEIESLSKKLANKNFIQKAPVQVVDKVREKENLLKSNLNLLEKNILSLE
ncbi:MAG: valine--tRNA ligase [Spirochaetes bacterium]|nr:valine--tRNA ligase [Spirochaetota bacterium]